MKTDNELIAEFMGIHVRFWDKVLFLSDEDGYVDIAGDAVAYWPNKSWSQLMPVVEKINGMGYDVLILGNGIKTLTHSCEITSTSDVYAAKAGDSLLETVYKAVVEFIKWYNSQTTTKEQAANESDRD